MKALLLLALSAFAGPAPKAAYDRITKGGADFDVPAGWTVEGRFGETDIYLGSLWWDAVPRTSGWAHMKVTTIDFAPAGAKPSEKCGLLIRSLRDYRDELDCSVEASCKPCPNKKCPRSPVGGHCGEFVVCVPAAGTKGFFYRQVIDPEDTGGASASVEFNRALRSADILVAPPGAARMYRLSFTAPEKEFDKHLPAFQRLAANLRDNPNR